MDVCAVCQERGHLKRCTGCLSVCYCSKEHQKVHWKVHKNSCCPFKITHDPIFGQQLIATRDLNPGTLILEEKPILYKAKFTGDNWVCLACGNQLYGIQLRLCSTCRWPICSVECEQAPMHKEYECFVFASQKVQFPPTTKFSTWFDGDSAALCQCIHYIRALMLKKLKPSSYKALMNTFFDCAKYQQNWMETVEAYQLILDELIDLDQLGVRFDSNNELLELTKVLVGNSISDLGDQKQDRAEIHGSFIISSRMSHSCQPNCIGLMYPFPFYRQIKTITPVHKGQSLTFNYFNAVVLKMNRRERLGVIMREWGFLCHCERCLDPTENGSFMDGIVCPTCRPRHLQQSPVSEDDDDDVKNLGYFLPLQPLDLEPSAKWKCNSCHDSKSRENVQKPVKILKDIWDKMKTQYQNVSAVKKLEILNRFSNICTRDVHPNHFIVMEVAEKIVETVMMVGFDKMDKNQFQIIKNHSLYLLSIEDKIVPGLSVTRGLSLTKLSLVLLSSVTVMGKEFSKQELLDLLTSALKYSKEAELHFDLTKGTSAQRQQQADQLAFLRSDIEVKLRAIR